MVSRKTSRGLSKTPPPPEALSRLQISARTPSGKPKHWRDPLTGKRYSNRKRQEAYNGGLTIERMAKLKKENPRARESLELSREDYSEGRRRRGGGPSHYFINYSHLANLYAQRHGIDPEDALEQDEFWEATDVLEGMLSGSYGWRDIADDMWDDFGIEDRDDAFNSGGETE